MKSITKTEKPTGFLVSNKSFWIISGGQSGADRAGLAAAYDSGIHTGGFAPAGYRTLDFENPKVLQYRYGLVELPTISYAERTKRNIQSSDCTIRFAKKWNSAGEKCTLKWLKYYDKPYLDIEFNSDPRDTIPKIEQYIIEQHTEAAEFWPVIINIAGNSETSCPGIYDWTYAILTETFKRL